jgi:hypothetical protein
MKTDMSPHSITMRIEKTSELRRLCIALGAERLKKRLQKQQIQTGPFNGNAIDKKKQNAKTRHSLDAILKSRHSRGGGNPE